MTLKFSQKCFRDSWILVYFRFDTEAVGQRCSVKKVLLEISKNSQENTCARVFFNKVAGLRPATLLKKRAWHWCFAVNFTKFLRTSFYIEHLWWLLLFDGYFMFIAKGKLYFSLICSFYCCLVKRSWGLKVAQQFSMRGLVVYKLVSYKKN